MQEVGLGVPEVRIAMRPCCVLVSPIRRGCRCTSDCALRSVCTAVSPGAWSYQISDLGLLGSSLTKTACTPETFIADCMSCSRSTTLAWMCLPSACAGRMRIGIMLCAWNHLRINSGGFCSQFFHVVSSTYCLWMETELMVVGWWVAGPTNSVLSGGGRVYNTHSLLPPKPNHTDSVCPQYWFSMVPAFLCMVLETENPRNQAHNPSEQDIYFCTKPPYK